MAHETKEGKWLLHNIENKLKDKLVPLVPKKIETYHLTLTTIIWSLGVILFTFLARYNIQWLWATSFMIICQYITDLLDGEIGRRRKTGLIKWGYYMDHMLDFIFLCAILLGYSALLPIQFNFLLFIALILFGSFMANSFLAFGATNKMRISYLGIGPTEIRIVFIIINTLIIMFGKTYMVPALPYIVFFSLIGLVITIYKTQKEIWDIDMRKK